MSSKAKNLAIVAGLVAFFGWWALDLILAEPPVAPAAESSEPGPWMGPDGSPLEDAATNPSAPSPPAVADPATSSVLGSASSPSLGSTAMSPRFQRRSYAVSLHELQGLSPDAAPGTKLELWVAWDPPITKGPRLQKLLTDVVLEKVVPGAVPEAPVTAILSIRHSDTADLMWADRYGSLSAVVVP